MQSLTKITGGLGGLGARGLKMWTVGQPRTSEVYRTFADPTWVSYCLKGNLFCRSTTHHCSYRTYLESPMIPLHSLST